MSSWLAPFAGRTSECWGHSKSYQDFLFQRAFRTPFSSPFPLPYPLPLLRRHRRAFLVFGFSLVSFATWRLLPFSWYCNKPEPPALFLFLSPLVRRPLIVVLNRVDTASAVAVAQWKKYLVTEGGLRADNRGGNVPVFFVDSKRGRGVHEVCVCVCVRVCLSVCLSVCQCILCVFLLLVGSFPAVVRVLGVLYLGCAGRAGPFKSRLLVSRDACRCPSCQDSLSRIGARKFRIDLAYKSRSKVRLSGWWKNASRKV